MNSSVPAGRFLTALVLFTCGTFLFSCLKKDETGLQSGARDAAELLPNVGISTETAAELKRLFKEHPEGSDKAGPRLAESEFVLPQAVAFVFEQSAGSNATEAVPWELLKALVALQKPTSETKPFPAFWLSVDKVTLGEELGSGTSFFLWLKGVQAGSQKLKFATLGGSSTTIDSADSFWGIFDGSSLLVRSSAEVRNILHLSASVEGVSVAKLFPLESGRPLTENATPPHSRDPSASADNVFSSIKDVLRSRGVRPTRYSFEGMKGYAEGTPLELARLSRLGPRRKIVLFDDTGNQIPGRFQMTVAWNDNLMRRALRYLLRQEDPLRGYDVARLEKVVPPPASRAKKLAGHEGGIVGNVPFVVADATMLQNGLRRRSRFRAVVSQAPDVEVTRLRKPLRDLLHALAEGQKPKAEASLALASAFALLEDTDAMVRALATRRVCHNQLALSSLGLYRSQSNDPQAELRLGLSEYGEVTRFGEKPQGPGSPLQDGFRRRSGRKCADSFDRASWGYLVSALFDHYPLLAYSQERLVPPLSLDEIAQKKPRYVQQKTSKALLRFAERMNQEFATAGTSARATLGSELLAQLRTLERVMRIAASRVLHDGQEETSDSGKGMDEELLQILGNYRDGRAHYQSWVNASVVQPD